ncbi:sulfotransferase family 2 domain-containing protein [Martelella mediterranea]|uniref:sulfotransferase family 2 domain-containing protein n=1 Tax=Martelella mediterranea TaxID=293089 RepID=UPI001E2DEB78|nr:sulfotransferase family 2 domain-containing protein [Martelella mediterranea]MCD1636963.1 sulfotransferase family 2 domain-containing protein [Martelella mediterranea]
MFGLGSDIDQSHQKIQYPRIALAEGCSAQGECEVICHEHKCIFVHIQGTAGTSVEEWIVGRDWWEISPQSKHLTASTARQKYAPYWDDYFKFSIVREPVARMKSLLRFPEISLVNRGDDDELDLERYLSIYQRQGVVVEYDWRFFERSEVARPSHEKGTLYGNILDEELDYVGYFENLEEVIKVLRDSLKIDRPFNFHAQASSSELSRFIVPDLSRKKVQKLFWKDYEKFDFGVSVAKLEKSDDNCESAQPLSGAKKEATELKEKVALLTLYRDGYRRLIDEMNEKNKVVATLRQTLESVIEERDALATLKGTVDSLITERDALKERLRTLGEHAENLEEACQILKETVHNLIVERDSIKEKSPR